MARVVLGVGGSIAAYKAVDLASKLVQAGHEVSVVLTRNATRFVTPLSFGALTHRAVLTDEDWWKEAGPAAHLAATEGAHAFVVAPCTADLIAKFAHGIADEIVSTTYLGAPCPTWIAPAMNARMWKHARVAANLERLREDGVHVVAPGTGFLAEGPPGVGRMAEPAEVMKALEPRLAGR
jgi:phosphopantothenoylcysteine decarboxylase/phosphopantothenate--cysteine ligase